MKVTKGIWSITIICIFFGFFTVRFFDNQRSIVEIGEVTSIKTIEYLLKHKKLLEEKKQELDDRMIEKESAISNFEDVAAQKNIIGQEMQQKLSDVRSMAGLLPLEGPGIEIQLNDRKRDTILSNNPSIIQYYIVHDSDMLNVINELRSVGAEAIAVNGTRIMATSRISCGGPTINVGKYGRFAPPFIIQAIGDPEALQASFQSSDSIYHDLITWGLEFHIKQVSNIQIPRYLGDADYTYARSIKEGE